MEYSNGNTAWAPDARRDLHCSIPEIKKKKKKMESFHANQNIGQYGDFPVGPVVTNLPSNARDACLIPGWGTKIPHAMG